MCEAVQPDELQKSTCVERVKTLRLQPEQLRKLISDHRNKLKDVRWNLLAQVKTLEKEILTCEAVLADLTTD